MLLKTATRSLLSLIALATLMCSFASTTNAYDAKPNSATESQQRLLQDVKFLADDAMEGRGIGTDGLDKAADFIRDEFQKAGLDVTQVEGGAFQKFTIVTGTDPGDNNSLQFVSADGQTIDIEYDTDYRACSFGNSGTFDGEIVFAGYGIKANNPKYNDFSNADVEGKVVVIIRRTPKQGVRNGPFSGRRAGQYGDLRSKVKNAVDAGAVAVVVANDPHGIRTASVRAKARMKQAADRLKRAKAELSAVGDDESKKESATSKVKLLQSRFDSAQKAADKTDHDDLMKFGYAGNANDQAIPVFHVRQTAVNKLLTASIGKTLTDLESAIDQSFQPATTLLTGWKAKGASSITIKETEVKNVIGVIDGEGDLAKETVVIGAHYDHVGMGITGSLSQGGPAIHNGADDNASGTASLIEVARRISSQPNKPKRRMVFIAFTAEESGLIGSARYCSEPIFPLEDTVAMFNMDMVGRLTGNRLTIYGTGTATGWDKRIAALGLKHQFDLGMKPEGLGPSDHASFYKKQIPALHFFTGVHPNYHRPSDDWDLLNVPGMARIVDSVEEIAMETAQAADRPEYLEVSARAKINETATRPFFGIVPDLTSDADGLVVASVTKDGPAESAGVQTGDIIIKFVGKTIGNLRDFDELLRSQKVDEPLEVVVQRDGNEVSLKVKLSQP